VKLPALILRLRVPLGFLFAAGYLAFAIPQSWLHLAMVAIPVVIGCGIRSWAAGYLLKGKRVAIGGPYAWVRNPLYVGSFILGLGFCAVLWRDPLPGVAWALWASYVLSYGVIYPAKVRAEEAELREALGDEYVRYASRVPRFVPICGAVSGLGEQHFSAELYKRNREYQCILGCAAVFAFLAIRYALHF